MTIRIQRREFLTALGTTAAWPFAARAQQARLPTIGYVGANTPATQIQWTNAFVQRLHELGWIEGRNVAIEYRWAEGRTERYAQIVAEFVRLNVDVILTHGTPATVQAKQRTPLIPIVFTVVGDPIGTGLVASLARPGGNLTGLSIMVSDLAAKRLELLQEVIPKLRRLGILGNVDNPSVVLEMDEVEATARKLGLQVSRFGIRRAEDITAAFEALRGTTDALHISGDPLVLTNGIRISMLAVSARLPTIHIAKEYVQAGGLISYGPNYPDLYRRAADYVDKLLRGAKPADLPVEQPTKFDLVINVTTARALGLTVSPSLLARADEVIE